MECEGGEGGEGVNEMRDEHDDAEKLVLIKVAMDSESMTC